MTLNVLTEIRFIKQHNTLGWGLNKARRVISLDVFSELVTVKCSAHSQILLNIRWRRYGESNFMLSKECCLTLLP